MQLSELQRRKASGSVPKFTNHTPRPWEITSSASAVPTPIPAALFAAAAGPSQSLDGGSEMFGARPTHPGMTIGADPLYSNTSIMGQTPSSSSFAGPNRSNIILREDSIVRHVEEVSYDDEHDYSAAASGYSLPPLSRDDSWSIHYHCTDQAPYSNTIAGASNPIMITQNSLVKERPLPVGNASRDLAKFLRTTGPVTPQRRPSKVEPEPPRRAVSGPKKALRFLKLGGGHAKRQTASAKSTQRRLSIRDEGGLLADVENKTPQPIPDKYEQKISSTGKPYLALHVPPTIEKPTTGNKRNRFDPNNDHRNILEPEVLESRVSVCFHEEGSMSEVIDSYLTSLSQEHSIASRQTSMRDHDDRPATSYEEVASRLARRCPTPIRPAASNPPSPVPDSAISRTESYRSGFPGPATARPSIETTRSAFKYPPRTEEPRTPTISLPEEEFPVKHLSPEKEFEIKHPLPRRLGSHPVLLQRASSLASTLYPTRSVSDSPGPPPPRSPLRVRRDPRSIESIITNEGCDRKMTPRTAPSIKSTSDYDFGVEPIRATVTTECTGPIKRPKSRNKGEDSPHRMPYPLNRREREERLRARKRPVVNRTIDSVVHAPVPNATRQRLKKLRPQIQIPELRPQPLRTPSVASSASSWQKVTQSTLTPVSPVPSEATDIEEDRTGYTPISPTASAEARAMQAGIGLSPFMIVAEQAPVPKTKSPSKPARLILKEPKSKPYAPRPRSASIPRSALKRRSRNSTQNNSIHSSPRGKSPVFQNHDDEEQEPPLPSPPPNRALPPTPPVSGSERARKANSKAKVVSSESSNNRKTQLSPLPPSHEASPIDSNFSRNEQQRLPHVVTQQRRAHASPSRSMSRIDHRLEALEKQNALLSAALMAVLQTNGGLNGPISAPEDSPVSKGPMAWETRVARRSAATSHTASSSNGSALEMYMSTRRGSRHGY